MKVDNATQSRVQHLEALVADYKATVERMEREIEELGGDPSAVGGLRPRHEIVQELEEVKAARDQAEQGRLHACLVTAYLTVAHSTEGGRGRS